MMGFLDTLLGRTKPVRAKLDALFALPSAAVTLEAAAGLIPGREAGVCFKPPAGRPFEEVQQEIEQLLATADLPTGSDISKSAPVGSANALTTGGPVQLHVRDVADEYGYRWIVLEGSSIDDLVTRVHMIHSSLEDAGWSTQLLCSVFAFKPGETPGADPSATVGHPVYFVYLTKQGKFYPFAPVGHERRDSELELRLRAVVGEDLPIEPDLSRWFPLWDLPFSAESGT